MIEIVIIFHFFLLLLNMRIINSFAAPSFLYTLVWFLVLLLHLLVDLFQISQIYSLSYEILIFFLLGTIFFNLGGFFAFWVDAKSIRHAVLKKYSSANSTLDLFLFLIPIIFLPIVYLKSLDLAQNSGIDNLFLGLRYQKNYGDGSLGILEYMTIWAIFDATWRYLQYKAKIFVWKQNIKMIISLIIAFCYAILTTGKTFPFLIIIALVGLKLNANEVRIKQGLVYLSALFAVFFLFSLFLEKGASPSNSFAKNLILVNETLLNYLLGPQGALDSVFNQSHVYELGFNSFRFFFAFFYKTGLSDIKPFDLVHNFTFVPFPTNAYTFYYPYILDFGALISLGAPFAFGLMHTKAYILARRGSLVATYVYSLMLYPLFMSFFQDQYLSLLSTWIQFAILILIQTKLVLSQQPKH